jgi:hypothetical protein
MSVRDSGQSESDYEFLRDAVMDAFNPPDGDGAEPSIMADAVERASAYIEDQPCYCEPQQETQHDYACGRCRALGRLHDEAISR